MLCLLVTCCNHQLPVSQANIECVAVSNYDRNTREGSVWRLPSWKSILRKQHLMFWMKAGKISNERQYGSMFVCWTAFLWMPKVWQMSATSTGWTVTCRQTRFHAPNNAKIVVGWEIEFNIFAFVHCFTVSFPIHPDANVQCSIVPCSIVPCVALSTVYAPYSW